MVRAFVLKNIIKEKLLNTFMKKSIRPPLRRKDLILEKFHFFFIWFVRITLLIAFYRSVFTLNWYVLGMTLFALLLTFPFSKTIGFFIV